MSGLIVFGGTSEGRQLYDFCAERGIPALFCVATDYGYEVLHKDRAGRPEVRVGRLTQEEMTALFRAEKPRLVIDATHPYAVQATAHIQGALRRYVPASGTAEPLYCRVGRELGGPAAADAAVCADMAQAVAYLNGTEGRILVTTGSKEIEILCKLNNYAERAYVRILPDPDVLKRFLDRGFPAGHMLCMQGPFTEAVNRALLEQYDIRYLLTKQSGKAGGYEEKCRAAEAAGVQPVVILPPDDTAGCSIEEAQELILRRFDAAADSALPERHGI